MNNSVSIKNNVKTDGIVIREQTIGESDRVVTVLTRDIGVIRAFARHAKNPKDPKSNSTSLLCYSDFTIHRGKDKYYIENAVPKNVFFDLRMDIESLSLAQYFCELANELVPEETDSAEYLRLILNSLHFLGKRNKPYSQIKAITELRLMSVSGYMPDLVGCQKCGKYESETVWFLPLEGSFYCEDCFVKSDKPAFRIPYDVLHAMRHICYSDFEKIYSFSLSDDKLKLLAYTSEAYTVNTLGKMLKTLEFYKSLF